MSLMRSLNAQRRRILEGYQMTGRSRPIACRLRQQWVKRGAKRAATLDQLESFSVQRLNDRCDQHLVQV